MPPWRRRRTRCWRSCASKRGHPPSRWAAAQQRHRAPVSFPATSFATVSTRHSPVAQLAEHSAVNRRVVGSSPTGGAVDGLRGSTRRPSLLRRDPRRGPGSGFWVPVPGFLNPGSSGSARTGEPITRVTRLDGMACGGLPRARLPSSWLKHWLNSPLAGRYGAARRRRSAHDRVSSSAGQSSGLIIRRSWVQAPPDPLVRPATPGVAVIPARLPEIQVTSLGHLARAVVMAARGTHHLGRLPPVGVWRAVPIDMSLTSPMATANQPSEVAIGVLRRSRTGPGVGEAELTGGASHRQPRFGFLYWGSSTVEIDTTGRPSWTFVLT